MFDLAATLNNINDVHARAAAEYYWADSINHQCQHARRAFNRVLEKQDIYRVYRAPEPTVKAFIAWSQAGNLKHIDSVVGTASRLAPGVGDRVEANQIKTILDRDGMGKRNRHYKLERKDVLRVMNNGDNHYDSFKKVKAGIWERIRP